MKSKKTSIEIMEKLCGEIRDDDGMDPREFVKRETRQRFEKRDRQLCAQVKRSLDLALPETLLRLWGVTSQVVSVETAPDASRLRVTVSVQQSVLLQTQTNLPQLKGLLRSEIATEINRKRIPDLTFWVVNEQEMLNG